MRNLDWKLLSSNYIFKDRWFIARADSCELPDGRIIEPYYVIELPNWCNIVAITGDEKVIMVRQYRHALGKTILELPGGVIDAGETPEHAALRELKEETGYAVDAVQYLYKASPNPATNNNMAYFFLATGATPGHALNLDAFEDIEVELFTREQVLQLLKDEKVEHGMQVGAIYAAFAKLGWL
jgi:8-oxo-dGTP pyrophosphatase MutT (NUDIX family)